jgi:restriction endonuclease S subunit
MKIKLNNIASIQTGVYAKTNLEGNAHYLQLRHLNEFGELGSLTQLDLFVDAKMDRHILRDFDLLFVAKGSKNIATVYRTTPGIAVASSSFLVLRIREESKLQILPEYLVWFINTPHIQEKLKGLAKGSGIQSVAISDLANIEILVPNVETQKTILSIQQLRIKEKKLVAEIEALKEQYIQQKLFSHIK